MFKSIYAAVVGMALALGACAEGGDAPAGAGESAAALGAHADPWAPGAPAGPTPGVVVGPNGLRHPECGDDGVLVEAIADTTATWVRGDTGKECTATLVTRDNKVLVPAHCRTQVKGKKSWVVFDAYPSEACSTAGPVASGDGYPVVAEGLDVGSGFMVAQLGLRADGVAASDEHFLVRWNTNKGALTAQTNTADELIGAGYNAPAILADADCRIADVGSGSHTCDTLPGSPESAAGSIVVYDMNGCVPTASGCAPGTGPTSPGAFPGRVVGFHVGPDGHGANRLVYAAELTCPGCLLDKYLVPGNFNPLSACPPGRPGAAAPPQSSRDRAGLGSGP
ncbi:MAG TPA: hypothetical protein VFS43_21640 [Polyangiaceae bacterium]|nr:hypothetical protein [Polyangiaceae bacterium]